MPTLPIPATVAFAPAAGLPVTEVRQGLDDTQLAGVFAQYGPLIIEWAERIFSDGMTADDVLHEVMLRMLRKGAVFTELTGERQRRAWLRQTTLRICWDMKARGRRERGRAEEATTFDRPDRASPVEDRSVLERLCRELDVEERILAVLFFEEGYTKMEIHTMTGRSRPFIDKKLDQIAEELQRIEER